MAHPLRRALLTAAAFVCALLPAAPARAAGDLAVTVRGDDPLATVLVLTNRGDAPCQVVTSTYGTFAVTRLEPRAVEPSRLEPRVAVDAAPAAPEPAPSTGNPTPAMVALTVASSA